MNELSIYENLSLSTIRIECEIGNGNVSAGTGFFFKYVNNIDTFTPAIVTNKHVVEGAKCGRLFFTLCDKSGNPTHDHHHAFEITDFQNCWLNHPDPAVDLCVLPINFFIIKMKEKGIKPFITFFDLSFLPTEQDIEEMIGLEKVVMIGYPNGLWDATHNQPVSRSGVLASHYKFDWNGRPEFVIDAACVPGSSGSPVLLVDIGQVFTRKGLHIGSSRVKLLGVLHAGPVLSADGSIEVIPVPTVNTIQTRTDIPINLGYVIKAKKLIEFEAVLEKIK